jgi:AraC family transcriptional regulator
MQNVVYQNLACPDRYYESRSLDELAAKDGMTLGFRHLDLVMAIAPERSGQSESGLATGFSVPNIKRLRTEFSPKDRERAFQVADKTSCVEDILCTRAIGTFGDPVVQQLSCALTAAKCVNGPHTDIYIDAVRLAIVARLLCLQSETRQFTRCVDSIEPQMRTLQKWRLKRVVEYVDKHLARKITLAELAAVAGLSRMHFAAQFRAATNLRPHEYLLRCRIERAKAFLSQSSMALVEISLTVGFQTQAHFTTVFKRFVGETPYQWRAANGCAVDFSGQFRPAAGPCRCVT